MWRKDVPIFFVRANIHSKVKAAAKQKQTKAKKFSLQLSNLSISLGIILLQNLCSIVNFG